MLTPIEKGIIDLTIKCVEKVRSARLAKILERILVKVSEVLKSRFLYKVRMIGEPLAHEVSRIAHSWGNPSAANWAKDLALVMYLGVMRINANTTITLEIGTNRTGLFKLVVGSLLTVMPTRNRYLVQLPTAVIGIKGTVFYQQIFHPKERTAESMEQKDYPIPEGISEYFCLCNGLADFVDKSSMGVFFSDKADHHNSYFIDPRLPNPIVKAPMLNHQDIQIRELINLQEGPKHNSSFLDEYEGYTY